MTRAERLRAAAAAPRLADHVRVSHLDGAVRWRPRQCHFPLFVVRESFNGWGAWALAPGSLVYAGECLASPYLKRDAAVRAGLLALAEREECAS